MSPYPSTLTLSSTNQFMKNISDEVALKIYSSASKIAFKSMYLGLIEINIAAT